MPNTQRRQRYVHQINGEWPDDVVWFVFILATLNVWWYSWDVRNGVYCHEQAHISRNSYWYLLVLLSWVLQIFLLPHTHLMASSHVTSFSPKKTAATWNTSCFAFPLIKSSWSSRGSVLDGGFATNLFLSWRDQLENLLVNVKHYHHMVIWLSFCVFSFQGWGRDTLLFRDVNWWCLHRICPSFAIGTTKCASIES